MSGKLKMDDNVYDPLVTEAKLYDFWHNKGVTTVNRTSSILLDRNNNILSFMIPPPNVTGVLHLGHALDMSIIDSLIRYFSMCGKECLCVPGIDHAGIATQVKVMGLLHQEGYVTEEMSRKVCIERALSWKETQEKKIISQCKALGLSCNWEYYRFTMDDAYKHAVCTAFKRLFDAGRIYKGKYLVNWDTVLCTAIADEEVEFVPMQGWLWCVRYYFYNQDDSVCSNEYITVATTRIETIFVDIALAVHPDDVRYNRFIGQYVINPLTEVVLPIIGDSRVDMEFGTAVLKITPAHDKLDYAIAKEANLDPETYRSVLDMDTYTLNKNAGFCSGKTCADAQVLIRDRLMQSGHLEHEELYMVNRRISSRSQGLVEVVLSEQWFVSMKGIDKILESLVSEKLLTLYPQNVCSVFHNWVSNLSDWCISRQLWWGHRIPIWYSKISGEIVCSDSEDPPESILHDLGNWYQENDVLDTWFSSAIWPVAILGWPVRQELIEIAYPFYSVITGHDILFFWVIKMLFVCHFLVGEIPFTKACLHGLLYGIALWRKKEDGLVDYIIGDERTRLLNQVELPDGVYSKWGKMSKSKGNTVDPMEVIQTQGADVLRYSLLSMAILGKQIDVDSRNFDSGNKVLTKLWNAFCGVMIYVNEYVDMNHNERQGPEVYTMLWMEEYVLFSAMKDVVEKYCSYMESFEINKALILITEFFWNVFCSEYMEISKSWMKVEAVDFQLYTTKIRVLFIVFLNIVKLFHPFIPYITEKIYQDIRSKTLKDIVPSNADDVLFFMFKSPDMVSFIWEDLYCKQSMIFRPLTMSEDNDSHRQLLVEYEKLIGVISKIKTTRSHAGLSYITSLSVTIVIPKDVQGMWYKYKQMLMKLCNLNCLDIVHTDPERFNGMYSQHDDIKIYVNMNPDLLQSEKKRLQAKLDKILIHKAKVIDFFNKHSDLNGQRVSKVPQSIVDKKHALLEKLLTEESMLLERQTKLIE